MKTYSAKEIKEFEKMGYHIDEKGNLTKEVKLQKIIRTNTDATTIKNFDLKSFEINSNSKKISDRKMNQRYVGNTFTRVQEWFMDEEKLARGLATMKKPGVDYSLLSDGTKVCRCCQNRYTGDHFSANNAVKDGKMIYCKECDTRRLKSYNEEKSSHLKSKVK